MSEAIDSPFSKVVGEIPWRDQEVGGVRVGELTNVEKNRPAPKGLFGGFIERAIGFMRRAPEQGMAALPQKAVGEAEELRNLAAANQARVNQIAGASNSKLRQKHAGAREGVLSFLRSQPERRRARERVNYLDERINLLEHQLERGLGENERALLGVNANTSLKEFLDRMSPEQWAQIDAYGVRRPGAGQTVRGYRVPETVTWEQISALDSILKLRKAIAALIKEREVLQTKL